MPERNGRTYIHILVPTHTAVWKGVGVSPALPTTVSKPFRLGSCRPPQPPPGDTYKYTQNQYIADETMFLLTPTSLLLLCPPPPPLCPALSCDAVGVRCVVTHGCGGGAVADVGESILWMMSTPPPATCLQGADRGRIRADGDYGGLHGRCVRLHRLQGVYLCMYSGVQQ